MKPSTRYAKSGRINIAYQVVGSGNVDLIYIPGWISNIDLMWNCPELVSFLRTLGEKYRVVLFDKRGTGLSDRIAELSTLEERMDDIRAVMDDISSEKAILFGHSEGGSVSALFAATYPNRTIALITFGVFAKRRYSPDYPWAPTDEERQEVYDMIENNWGSRGMNLETLAPSKADDEEFMTWLANYFRSGASPSAALVLTKMNTQVDIIDILHTIHVPTLMMQRVNDVDVKIEEGRFIAERIDGAIFKEFDGDDHLFWVGNTDEVLYEMQSFISDLKPFEESKQKLLAIVTAEITTPSSDTGGFSLMTINEKNIAEQIQKYRGALLDIKEGIITAYFEGPSKAVHCCLDFQNALKPANVSLRAGVHMGECYLKNGTIEDGITLSKTKDIFSVTTSDEILVSQTIRNLLPEAELQFKHLNDHRSAKVFTKLFAVEDRFSESNSIFDPIKIENSKHGLLLERVLQATYDNIDNEFYGVEKLCQEVGLSERQLQRKIKAITNKSPNQLIRSVRLHKAKEMLIQNLDGVSQIAFKTGFTNPSYFAKCFKAEFGMSPSELNF